jgi:hypothetical protein
MVLFADTNAEAIRSSIDSLQRIFLIIIALAIGEAFKQFVSDKTPSATERHIYWDRLWALIAFGTLVVPFSHGMLMHFFDSHQTRRHQAYSFSLIFDTVMFIGESALFFVLSRSLSPSLWRTFYWTVFVLLLVDMAWGFGVSLLYGRDVRNWVWVNSAAVIVLAVILSVSHDAKGATDTEVIPSWWGLRLACVTLVARMLADYLTSFSTYFPGQTLF